MTKSFVGQYLKKTGSDKALLTPKADVKKMRDALLKCLDPALLVFFHDFL